MWYCQLFSNFIASPIYLQNCNIIKKSISHKSTQSGTSSWRFSGLRLKCTKYFLETFRRLEFFRKEKIRRVLNINYLRFKNFLIKPPSETFFREEWGNCLVNSSILIIDFPQRNVQVPNNGIRCFNTHPLYAKLTHLVISSSPKSKSVGVKSLSVPFSLNIKPKPSAWPTPVIVK